MTKNKSVSTPPKYENSELDLTRHEYYFNRELSHLQFNHRVLKQAIDESHPLLNRMLFCCIFSSNMDEFFEIRVAGLKHQIKFGRETISSDGLTPLQTLEEINQIAHKQVQEQYEILNEVLLPALAKEGIRFLRRSEWTEEQNDWLADYFDREILPIINPIGLDPSHPFPRLVNKSLNFIVELDGKDAFGRETGLAIVPAPRSLPRLIKLPADMSQGDDIAFLSSIIHAHASQLFPGMSVKGCYQFRLTRNADFELEQDDMVDLASALKGELLSRRFGDAVRLELADNCPDHLVQFLLKEFNLAESELYQVRGPVNLSRLMELSKLIDKPQLLHPSFAPGQPKKIKSTNQIFSLIKQKDILLLHPFQSFTPVVDLIRTAAKDPDVLAIKQTLYRTGANSEVVDALVEAARKNKEVTVIIELRARFDEEENLHLANRLQEAGAVVVYGVVGYKTHAKMMLIVRRENKKLRRYAHLGTGNYHAGNARLYTDYGLITCNKDITEDVHKIFMQITGMGKALSVKKLYHAPFTLHKGLFSLIASEIEHANQGKAARIIVKVNSLTEPKVIQALYKASQAGVKIECIVRGMCRLVPGVKGVSDNIQVRSIIGRFLEHTRVYYFANDGSPKIYGSSADWMERNLLSRVEVSFPIDNEKWVKRLQEELELYITDNCQSWMLQTDGSYKKVEVPVGEDPINAQQILLERFSI